MHLSKSRAAFLAAMTVAVLSLGLASKPAQAGRLVLQYTPNAAISVKLEGDEIVGIVNPTFGPSRAGKLELRLAGVPIQQFESPPYLFRIPLNERVQPLKGVRAHSFRIEPGLDYSIEAFVIQADNSRKSAAPAVNFRLEEETVTPHGPPPLAVSEEQLKRLLKEAFDEGFRRGQARAGPANPAPSNPGPAELQPVVEAPKPQTGRVMIRLWDEKGLPTEGTVRFSRMVGKQKITLATAPVSGQATIDLPPGPVDIAIQAKAGYQWVLPCDQNPQFVLLVGQTVTRNIQLAPKERVR